MQTRVVVQLAVTSVFVVGLLLFGFAIRGDAQRMTSDGPPPTTLPEQFVHPAGDPVAGRDVFRYETFGNERFWTDAMRLPHGIAAARVTPLQALQLGLSVNFDALNDATKQALGAALEQVQNGADPNTTAFGDPAVTLSLINQNAVLGVVAFGPDGTRKPLGNTGTLDIGAGDRVGITCAVCHSITDNSLLGPNAALGTKGSVGKEVDGPTQHDVDVGAIFAVAERSRAYYPMLQLQFKALGNASIGRGDFPGLLTNGTTIPTEAEADRYLTGTSASGERYYPVGQFDALPDGVGNPTHTQPFFRTDLAAPWGWDGGTSQLQDFNNTVYTLSLDPTSVLTPSGRQLLNVLAGPVGDEIATDYETVLRGIGVVGPTQPLSEVIPFVTARDGLPVGAEGSVAGRRVDDQKLVDLNGYLDSLPAPAPPALTRKEQKLAAKGRQIFRTISNKGGNCTACHQVDPNRFVPPNVIPMEVIYPGYSPTLIFDRPDPLDDIQDSGGPSPFFDDRTVVLDASLRGEPRGVALPLKLDMARKRSFLHDDSVKGATFDEAMDLLMNPSRGPMAAHPFYIKKAADRRKVVLFLKSLG